MGAAFESVAVDPRSDQRTGDPDRPLKESGGETDTRRSSSRGRRRDPEVRHPYEGDDIGRDDGDERNDERCLAERHEGVRADDAADDAGRPQHRKVPGLGSTLAGSPSHGDIDQQVRNGDRSDGRLEVGDKGDDRDRHEWKAHAADALDRRAEQDRRKGDGDFVAAHDSGSRKSLRVALSRSLNVV